MGPKLRAKPARKRSRIDELRDSDEYFQYLRDTPSTSKTTSVMKFKAFLRYRTAKASKSVNDAKKCERHSKTRELECGSESKRGPYELRKCYVRIEEKTEVEERKRKAGDEESVSDNVHQMSLCHPWVNSKSVNYIVNLVNVKNSKRKADKLKKAQLSFER